MTVLSVNVISASDVNITDSYSIASVDDTSDTTVSLVKTDDLLENSVSAVSNMDNDSTKVSLSNEEVLEYDNSNTLSNSDSISILSSYAVINNVFTSNNVNESDVFSKIDLSKTIIAKDITKYYKGSTKYSATFLDDYGYPLVNYNVKIIVNGVSHNKTTNTKGKVSLDINLNPGNYKISTFNPITGFRKTNSIKILSTIVAGDISKVYTDGRKFTATFYKSSGKVLAKKILSLDLIVKHTQ